MAAQDGNLVNFSEWLKAEPGWYLAFQGVDPEIFNRSYQQGRKRRAWAISLQRYQSFPLELRCAIRCKKLATTDKPQVIRATNGIDLKFWIGGGSDIPHFGVKMTLKRETDPSFGIAMTAIWTAFGERGYKNDRTPTWNPTENSSYTFSSRLQGASIAGIILSQLQAIACNGSPDAEGYVIKWSHVTAPYVQGFDIPVSTQAMFSNAQKDAYRTFCLLQSGEMEMEVVTRTRRDLMDYWRHLTAMPNPTPGPYPNYDCRFVIEHRRFSPVNRPPPLTQFIIREQNLARDRQWVNNPPLFSNPEIFISMDAPWVFHSERHYEVFKISGLFREIDHQQTNYCNHFNRTYSFDLWPAALIHSTLGRQFGQYFYALLDPSSTRMPTDAALEQNPPIPEPGTPVQVKVAGLTPSSMASQLVKHQTSLPSSVPKDEWNGVVIETPEFPNTATVPRNAICVRLKRSDRASSTGTVLHLTGFIKFGQSASASAFIQFRSAIRIAMYGSHHFGIPANNDVRELLLARNNSTIRFHAEKSQLPPTAMKFLHTLKVMNVADTQQLKAIESALKPKTSFRDFFSLITGPPGTGKTDVSMMIAVHHYRAQKPVLIVCGSNYGLDVVFHRVNRKLKENFQGYERVPGVYRLSTDLGEDADTQNAPKATSAVSDLSAEFNEEMEQLKRAGINAEQFKVLKDSLKSSLNSDASLGSHILSRLELAIQSPRRVDSTELNLLRKYMGWMNLLSRRGYLYAEQAEVPDSSMVQHNSSSYTHQSIEDPDEIVKRMISQARAAWLQLQEKYISEAKIIFCTASTASRQSLRSFRPAIVIVEEASQITEPTCLNAVIKYYSSLEKVVLSGDVAQLPPTVTSYNCNEFYASEKLSLFDRMLKTGVPGVMLTTQYRMHPDISAFVNATFYQGKLINGPGIVRENATLFSNYMKRKYNTSSGASFFLSVFGSSVWKRKTGSSLFNPEYICAIAELILGLVKMNCPQEVILVLTYYSEELHVLRQLINQHLGLKKILIQTVDASQGKENSIVIVSTTRPGREYGLGFVADLQRQCVALSRARDGLVIFGNKFMIKNRRDSKVTNAWDDLVTHHQMHERLIEIRGDRSQLFSAMSIPNERDYVPFTRPTN